LYDDIGVALDRLHKSDEALQIMAKKRALLPPFDAKNSAMKEAWYRYYANAGTFRAHRFLGAKKQDIGEMKKARDYIKRAMEIKPNAHFGREKYQLLAMEWIMAVKTKKSKETLGDWIRERDQWQIYDGGEGSVTIYDSDGAVTEKAGQKADSPDERAQKLWRRHQATEGLSGLIVLGAAWESVDVFEALARSLQTRDGITLSHIAFLRTQELLKQGRKSMQTNGIGADSIQDDLIDSFSDDMDAGVNDQNQKTLYALFPKLRAQADIWSGQRTAYMLSRLQKGQHPDTHPTFWKEWKPAAPPSLKVDWFNQGKNRFESEGQIEANHAQTLKAFLILGGTVAASVLALRFVKRRRITA
jgi:tetratricopeptide (TPR) repeat protein